MACLPLTIHYTSYYANHKLAFPLTLSPFSPAHTSLLASPSVLAVILLARRVTTTSDSITLIPCLPDLHVLENEKKSMERLLKSRLCCHSYSSRNKYISRKWIARDINCGIIPFMVRPYHQTCSFRRDTYYNESSQQFIDWLTHNLALLCGTRRFYKRLAH